MQYKVLEANMVVSNRLKGTLYVDSKYDTTTMRIHKEAIRLMWDTEEAQINGDAHS